MAKAPLRPTGFHRHIPLLPHQHRSPITPTQDMIVLCHLGVPRLAREDWHVEIAGLVDRPLRLSLADLQARFQRVEVESVHQCAGSPLEPTVATRRVCNVVWSGVRLADVLEAVGVKPQARFVWSTGADHGDFSGVPCEAYVKDLPLARVADGVLLADQVNGEALPAEHGFPLRLVVPGFYGTNSVKWLTRIELAAARVDSPFTTRWYNDTIAPSSPGAAPVMVPVWALAPEAIITSPAPAAILRAGEDIAVAGWAWADAGVAEVKVSCEAHRPIHAELEPVRGRAWQRFRAVLRGVLAQDLVLQAAATSRDGATQPQEGARNAVHRVGVQVR